MGGPNLVVVYCIVEWAQNEYVTPCKANRGLKIQILGRFWFRNGRKTEKSKNKIKALLCILKSSEVSNGRSQVLENREMVA